VEGEIQAIFTDAQIKKAILTTVLNSDPEKDHLGNQSTNVMIWQHTQIVLYFASLRRNEFQFLYHKQYHCSSLFGDFLFK
jgi:hypothetical protein